MPGGYTFAQFEERFWGKVDKNGPVPPHMVHLGPCWTWLASLSTTGYGQVNSRRWLPGSGICRAHRVAFFLVNGRWPNECCLHKCDNRLCVRPDHMFEGSVIDNNNDMVAKGRKVIAYSSMTHCKRGHELVEANLYRWSRAPTRRMCRACALIRKRARRQALREQSRLT